MPKTTNPVTQKDGVSVNVILTVVVVVVAVAVIGGILLFTGGRNGPSESETGPAVPAQLLQKQDSNVVVETPDAKVTLVEFLDYQCPACAQYYKGVTTKIEQEYGDRVTFVTRNFPITDKHPLAIPAAKAAEAAAVQGKYKQMYDKLYQNWETWAVAPNGQEVASDEKQATETFEKYAQQIGLDLEKFRQDRDSPQIQQRIERDVADAEKAGVKGTPTLFVNGHKFDPGEASTGTILDQLRAKIDRELQK